MTWVPEKFFNVNEMEETLVENLPKTSYQVLEKVDGSFVSMSYWSTGNEWIFATRGSFESEQAQHAKLIFLHKDGTANPTALSVLNTTYSYIFEVLYPENRHNEGARLVVDYGSERTLVGLTIYDKIKKIELDYEASKEEFDRIGFRTAKRFEHNINEVIELQKTLPAQIEGFVVLFANGLRVKFKTAEYIRMNKVLNSMNIKTVWESMANGKVSEAFMQAAPEEIRVEIEKYKTELENAYYEILEEAKKEQMIWLPVIPNNAGDKSAFKTIAEFMATNAGVFKYPMLVFPLIRNKDADSVIMKLIKPHLGD